MRARHSTQLGAARRQTHERARSRALNKLTHAHPPTGSAHTAPRSVGQVRCQRMSHTFARLNSLCLLKGNATHFPPFAAQLSPHCDTQQAYPFPSDFVITFSHVHQTPCQLRQSIQSDTSCRVLGPNQISHRNRQDAQSQIYPQATMSPHSRN